MNPTSDYLNITMRLKEFKVNNIRLPTCFQTNTSRCHYPRGATPINRREIGLVPWPDQFVSFAAHSANQSDCRMTLRHDMCIPYKPHQCKLRPDQIDLLFHGSGGSKFPKS